METINWRNEIDASFGDGPAVADPVGAPLAAGRRTLRRRRFTGALGVVAAVSVLAVVAPSVVGEGDPEQSSEAQVQALAPTSALTTLAPVDRATELELSINDLQRLTINRETGELSLPDALKVVDQGTVPGTDTPTYEVGLGGGKSLYLAVGADGGVVAKRDAAGALAEFGQQLKGGGTKGDKRIATSGALSEQNTGDR